MDLTRLKKIALFRYLALRWRCYLSRHSYTHGKGNLKNFMGFHIHTKVQITGNNNIIESSENAVIINSLIKISGDYNHIIIGNNAYLEGVEIWIEDNSCEIKIGANTYIGNNSHIACTEDNHRIIVGNNCMISSNVQIRTGDSHSILSVDGERINYAKDVTIGDHCWIGAGARILKGTRISNDSIVGSGAIVTKTFGPHVVIAGIPGKIVKENVTWDSLRL